MFREVNFTPMYETSFPTFMIRICSKKSSFFYLSWLVLNVYAAIGKGALSLLLTSNKLNTLYLVSFRQSMRDSVAHWSEYRVRSSCLQSPALLKAWSASWNNMTNTISLSIRSFSEKGTNFFFFSLTSRESLEDISLGTCKAIWN